ncbi:hypothetical protein G9A89_000643 [Geosiphon pyriformis]|nr:hypothetical protein G9A89_000643 [Geosiphon pyriformis]
MTFGSIHFFSREIDKQEETNAGIFANEFTAAVQLSDLDIMWDVLCKILTLLANEIFKKKWFKNFDGVFTRDSLRFHRLELLVSKLVKASCLVSSVEFASLLDMWYGFDANSASVVKSLFLSGSNFNMICSALAKVRKSYCSSKLLESRWAEKTCIKTAINKKWKVLNQIRVIPLEVVLDYLVVGNELVLEPSLVKSRVDKIMEGWTRKCRSLEYVFDSAFSDMMCLVSVDELLGVISDLLEDKTTGFSEILNKLWKHCNKSILDMLLVLLNSCLICKSVPGAWKEAWVSMIPKLYEWDRIFMNTQPIALIETVHKILSKILSDRISSACSTFDVLCGENFSVLKDTITQSPIFAIGSVVEDALEKGCELWLVLQNMQKAYDSVGESTSDQSNYLLGKKEDVAFNKEQTIKKQCQVGNTMPFSLNKNEQNADFAVEQDMDNMYYQELLLVEV